MAEIREFHSGCAPREPVVWIIDTQQWPRALLRAELIERGFDAVGFLNPAHALSALKHPCVERPSLFVLELFGLSFKRDELEALARFGVPTILLGGAAQLNRGFVGELEWAAVMKRPFTIGAVADLVDRISGRRGQGGRSWRRLGHSLRGAEEKLHPMERDKHNLEVKMIEAFTALRGKRVLEVGCGDGRLTASLAGRGADLFAVDPDTEDIRAARGSIPGVHFSLGSGEHLAFGAESFDCLIFTLSLHHQESRQALREAHRVLKSGGRLIVLEPALDGEVQRVYHLFHNETRDLEKARQAMDTSDFVLKGKEVFSVDWVHEDREALYAYHFDYCRMPRDATIIKRVDALLGDRVASRPLVLKDKLMIFSLQKRPEGTI